MWKASLQVEMLNSWTDESGCYHMQGWEQSQADILDFEHNADDENWMICCYNQDEV